MCSPDMIQAVLDAPVKGPIDANRTRRSGTSIQTGLLLGSAFALNVFSQAHAQDWKTVNEFIAPTGAEFGESVAISRDGKTALVAAAKEDCAEGPDCGAAHVFILGPAGWQKEAKLTASDPIAQMEFGGSTDADNTVDLSADGNTALVATNPFSLGKGAVYVFEREAGVWRERQILTLPEELLPGPRARATDAFGYTVALSDSGEALVVGAYLEGLSSDTGAAYVFVKEGPVWNAKARLTGSGAVADLSDETHPRISKFGQSVAISGAGDTVFVGAPGTASTLQSAYVFQSEQGVWKEKAILTPAAGSAAKDFGSSLALARDGGTAVVGGAGNAFVYHRDGTGGNWRQEAELGSDISEKQSFGLSVDLDDAGNTALVGDWGGGTVYRFGRQVTGSQIVWHSDAVVSGAKPGTAGGALGSTVAMSGEARTLLSSYSVYGPSSCPDGGAEACTVVHVLQQQ